MCGIAGVAGRVAMGPEPRRVLDAMTDAIVHRGPDDAGFFLGPHVALGMRRLSIIDVHGGHQPLCNEDSTVHVVFNGEIYNHHDLRKGLIRQGHRFQTDSDTEVLVHLYEEYGTSLVTHLRGMFTFALWDARREVLLIARDRFGIKPLYYWPHQDGVVFASELRCLLAYAGRALPVSTAAVHAYLAFGYVPDPLSVYEAVAKLPPGHLLTWQPGRAVECRPYWSIPVAATADIGESEAITELTRLIDEAVGLHLESEVPLGAFLSGGIDSSLVVASMARQSGRPVRTFSIGFAHAEYDESAHAREIAEFLRTEHTEFVLTPDVDGILDGVVQLFDEPFADSSAVPTYLVCSLARRDVTVALSGDGGDELFGGYTRYTDTLACLRLPAPVRQVLQIFAQSLPRWAPGKYRLLDLSRSREGRYATTVLEPVVPDDGGAILPGSARADLRIQSLLSEAFAKASGQDFLGRMSVVDIQSYLPGDILTKVDRCSMAVSLEARVPLLDHVLAEFAIALPASLKIRAGRGKWVLRKVLADRLPQHLTDRPKQGFAVPLRPWFRGRLRHRLSGLGGPQRLIREFVDPEGVGTLVREHLARRRDNSSMLWRLLALEKWLDAADTGLLAHTPARPPIEDLLRER